MGFFFVHSLINLLFQDFLTITLLLSLIYKLAQLKSKISPSLTAHDSHTPTLPHIFILSSQCTLLIQSLSQHCGSL